MSGQAAKCQVQPDRTCLELPGLLDTSSPQRPVLLRLRLRKLPARGAGYICLQPASNPLLQVICKGSGCSPVGGSYPTSSGQFGLGGYGTSSSYQTGSIANCRHGQNCNVGSSGSYGYGSSSGSGSYGGSSVGGSIANCRFGQNCNVGYNTGSSSGSFNNGGFGSSGQQYNPYGNGQQVSLGSILQGRKTKEGSVNFS